ncbi:hypothetical protein MASR2M54_12720 [Aliarcobacter cryaerophilus]
MTTYFAHESAYVDDNVNIGDNTKIWHFSHILSGTNIELIALLVKTV